MIFQNSFVADKQASQIRKTVIDNHQIISIDSFPERDSKKKRVFENVKMSVCILLMQKGEKGRPFIVSFWDDKNKSSGTQIQYTANEIHNIDKDDYCIPRIKQHEIGLVVKLRKMDKLPLKCYEGELNMTFHRHYFNDNKSNPPILKGASIQRYYITYHMSQGEVEYLNEARYLAENSGEKSNHHLFQRIAMQGMTGANDKIRLIMSLVEPGIYLANSCNYLIPTEKLPAKFILGIMNSKLLNWYFRCFSTNSNVNGYEVESFPLPRMTNIQQQPIIDLVNQILLKKQSNPNADTSIFEHKIDELVYDLYGLTEDEIAVIES